MLEHLQQLEESLEAWMAAPNRDTGAEVRAAYRAYKEAGGGVSVCQCTCGDNTLALGKLCSYCKFEH